MVGTSSAQEFPGESKEAGLAEGSQQQLPTSVGELVQSTKPVLPSTDQEHPKQTPGSDAAQPKSNLVRRSRRRKRHEVEVEHKTLWELHRRYSEISAAAEVNSMQAAQLRAARDMIPEGAGELRAADREHLAGTHRKRLADMTKHCLQVLKPLMQHKWGYVFNHPVDTTRYADYLRTIQQPMDLGTIKGKADKGLYASPYDFRADVELVFSNACRYNAAGTDVHIMATTLKDKFEEKWSSSMAQKLNDEAALCRNEEAQAAKRSLAEAKARVAANLEAQVAEVAGKLTSLEADICELKSMAAAACKPFSKAEKQWLVNALHGMSGEHFEWATSIMLAHEPKLAEQLGEQEISPDLDTFNALTLRQLQWLAKAHPPTAGSGGSGSLELDAQAGHPAIPLGWPGLPLGAGTAGIKQAPGKRARHGPPSPRKTGLGITSPSIGLPLQPSTSLDPPHNPPSEPNDKNAQQSRSADLQSPSNHHAAPTPVPQALASNPAAPTATPTSWQPTSQAGVERSDTGASSAVNDHPTPAEAAPLQELSRPVAAGKSAAQPMQDRQAEPGNTAMVPEQPEGPASQLSSDAREVPTPKPQRTLWHPHTGESLSGWKQAVSAAQEADQRTMLNHEPARQEGSGA
ncbi:hypothetical protein WJX74_000958 [Apatococcus lobatus]|uniref:Bromo domain-containing protein n=1 Tax=Apatococcus lobatus TaxID=904363 RepID=A0AAW1QWT1_9CHLO